MARSPQEKRGTDGRTEALCTAETMHRTMHFTPLSATLTRSQTHVTPEPHRKLFYFKTIEGVTMAGRLISLALADTINQNPITSAASAAPDHSMVRLIPNHDHHTNWHNFRAPYGI